MNWQGSAETGTDYYCPGMLVIVCCNDLPEERRKNFAAADRLPAFE